MLELLEAYSQALYIPEYFRRLTICCTAVLYPYSSCLIGAEDAESFGAFITHGQVSMNILSPHTGIIRLYE